LAESIVSDQPSAAYLAVPFTINRLSPALFSLQFFTIVSGGNPVAACNARSESDDFAVVHESGLSGSQTLAHRMVFHAGYAGPDSPCMSVPLAQDLSPRVLAS
jgi:hypothetical protein